MAEECEDSTGEYYQTEVGADLVDATQELTDRDKFLLDQLVFLSRHIICADRKKLSKSVSKYYKVFL